MNGPQKKKTNERMKKQKKVESLLFYTNFCFDYSLSLFRRLLTQLYRERAKGTKRKDFMHVYIHKRMYYTNIYRCY